MVTFEEWILYGIEHGYCEDVSCYTHNGFTLTEEENNEFDEGGDPCVPVVRVWVEADQQEQRATGTNDLMRVAKELCVELNGHIEGNGYAPFKVNKTSIQAMERIMRLDKKSVEEIREMMQWCQTHEFWLHNIRSPEKLRKHFETMLGQRRRDKRSTAERREVVQREEQKAIESMVRTAELTKKFAEEAVPMPADVRKAMRRGK